MAIDVVHLLPLGDARVIEGKFDAPRDAQTVLPRLGHVVGIAVNAPAEVLCDDGGPALPSLNGGTDDGRSAIHFLNVGVGDASFGILVGVGGIGVVGMSQSISVSMNRSPYLSCWMPLIFASRLLSPNNSVS